MVNINNNNISDFERLDTRVDAAVSEGERNAWERIRWGVRPVRTALAKIFSVPKSLPFPGIPNREYKDLPSAERTKARKNAPFYRDIRYKLSEEEMAKKKMSQPWTLREIPAMATLTGGGTAAVRVKINLRYQPWKSGVKNVDEVKDEIKNKNTAELTSIGISVIDSATGQPVANFSNFTEDQAKEIAKFYSFELTPYNKDLRRTLAAGGVSEANVQNALKFAHSLSSEDLARALSANDTLKMDADIQKLETKIGLNKPIEDLKNQNRQEMNLQEIRRKIGEIDSDGLNMGVPAAAIQTPELRTHLGLTSFVALNQVRADSIRSFLSNLRNKYSEAEKGYDQIKNTLEGIANSLNSAKIDFPSELNALLQGGRILPNNLTSDLDPKDLAEKISKALEMSSKEDMEGELKKIREKKKEAKEGKDSRSGREAVMAIYQKYFETKENMPPDQARIAAQELYGRNLTGRQEFMEVQKLVQGQQVLGENPLGLSGWVKEQAEELAFGSQEAFVCNLVESPSINLQGAGGKYRWPFRGTRRLGFLWRKHNARPPWGAADYPQLVTAFYALREAAKTKKDLSNTRYIRSQMREVSALLLTRFATRVVQDFDTIAIPDEERKEKDNKNERASLQRAFRLFLTGEVPGEYRAPVDEAIAYAEHKTGLIRKAVGNGVKNTVKFTYNYGLKTPVSLGYRATKWTGRTFVANPFKAIKNWALSSDGSTFGSSKPNKVSHH